MRRINITVDDNISDEMAIALTQKVMINGRLSSKYTKNDCYAYANNINGKYWVYADLTRKGNDTFRITSDNHEQEK